MKRDLLLAWGCPDQYACERTTSMRTSDPLGNAVALAANWYREMDDVLAAMVEAGDAEAIRAWADSSCWEDVGAETNADGEGDDPDGSAYAEAVRSALDDLADRIEDAVAE